MNNKPKFVYFETTTVKLSKILCKHLPKKDKIWKIIIRLWHNLRWAQIIPDCYWHDILQFKEKTFFLCHVELFCKFSRSFFVYVIKPTCYFYAVNDRDCNGINIQDTILCGFVKQPLISVLSLSYSEMKFLSPQENGYFPNIRILTGEF